MRNEHYLTIFALQWHVESKFLGITEAQELDFSLQGIWGPEVILLHTKFFLNFLYDLQRDPERERKKERKGEQEIIPQ